MSNKSQNRLQIGKIWRVSVKDVDLKEFRKFMKMTGVEYKLVVHKRKQVVYKNKQADAPFERHIYFVRTSLVHDMWSMSKALTAVGLPGCSFAKFSY